MFEIMILIFTYTLYVCYSYHERSNKEIINEKYMLISSYPVLMNRNIKVISDFFITHFAFEYSFVSDWYISLKHASGFELAVMDSAHSTIPGRYQANCKGIILNLEVDNVDEIYNTLKHNDSITFLLDIQSEDFGQRHFIIEAPGDILVDVIQVIPPSADYQENNIECYDQTE